LGGSCKTDRMEYDTVVCAILIRLKLLGGRAVEIMFEPLSFAGLAPDEIVGQMDVPRGCGALGDNNP
jgi:hypothetical protein